MEGAPAIAVFMIFIDAVWMLSLADVKAGMELRQSICRNLFKYKQRKIKNIFNFILFAEGGIVFNFMIFLKIKITDVI